MIVRICAWVGLALWVGGLALVAGIIAPAAFKILGKQEAGRLLGMLFPILDRWALVWGAVTVVSVLLLFMNRHFALRSLTLELPVGIMFFGRPFSEPILIRIASAYEAATKHRIPPPDFGPLPDRANGPQ